MHTHAGLAQLLGSRRVLGIDHQQVEEVAIKIGNAGD